MNKIMTLGKNYGELLGAVRLRRGMPVKMKDGRTGKVAFLAGADVHVDLDGPNPHCTGIVVRRADVRTKDGAVVGDLAGAQLNSKASRQQSRVVVDLKRARLEAEWKCAPED